MDIMTIRFMFLAIPMFWEMRSKRVGCRWPLELCPSTKLLWSARSSEQQMQADKTFMKFLVRMDMSYECYPQTLLLCTIFIISAGSCLTLPHHHTFVQSPILASPLCPCSDHTFQCIASNGICFSTGDDWFVVVD